MESVSDVASAIIDKLPAADGDIIDLRFDNQRWKHENPYPKWGWLIYLATVVLLIADVVLFSVNGGYVNVTLAIVPALFIVLLAASITVAILIKQKRHQDMRTAMLQQFAGLLGYSYSLYPPAGKGNLLLGAMALSNGFSTVSIKDVFIGSHGERAAEGFSLFFYKGKVYYELKFTKITFKKPLPAMLLVNALTITSLDVGAWKELKLEGDFQKHFVLYAPQGSEVEDLEIFTPDFMEALIEQHPDASLKCVGNDLYISGSFRETVVDWGKISKKKLSDFLGEMDFLIAAFSRFEAKEDSPEV
jgi:hypothetical protein